MSTSQVNWAGWNFSLDDLGTLRVSGVSWVANISLASIGWGLVETSEFPDELTISWRNGDALLAVRHSFDATWTMRWSVTNGSDAPLTLNTPEFLVESAWPSMIRDGFQQGWIVLDRGEDLVVGELVRGSMQLLAKTDESAKIRLAAGEMLSLDSSRSASSVSAVWRFEPVAGLQTLAARLPAWWPARTVLSRGEESEIDLPDGSITGDGVSQVNEGFVLSSTRTGVRSAFVHQGRTTTQLEWSVTEPLDEALARRADRIFREVTTPNSVHQFLVLRAITRQLIPVTHEMEAWLRLPTLAFHDVLEVANLTMRGQIFADDNVLEQAVRRASVLPLTFGAVIAWIGTSLAAQARGLATLPPPSGVPTGGLAGLLVSAERAVLTSAGDPARLGELRRLVQLLGRDLPVTTLSARRLAQAIALTRQLPECFESYWDWARDLGLIRQSVEGRLLAAEPDDETLAWLSF